MGSSLIRDVLGDTLGGPSIAFENGEFVLYTVGEYESPTMPMIILSAPTWFEFTRKLHDYRNQRKSNAQVGSRVS